MALERGLLEHTLAEAVDRRDADAVEVLERLPQRVGGTGQPGELAVEGVRLGFGGCPQRLVQRRAQPVLQLLGRSDRERHHQRLLEALDALLEQQPQEDADQRVGLAGAGAGLEQYDARIEFGARQVERCEFHDCSV